MKTSKRFDSAITALVNAFFNATLAKGNACCCAVGNIIAASSNGTIIIDDNFRASCDVLNIGWMSITVTGGEDSYTPLIKDEVKKIY